MDPSVDDPLVDSTSLVASFDEELSGWTASERDAGPAGSVGLTLPGDVVVDIDVAEPQVLTGLWVPAVDGACAADAEATVRALVGSVRSRALVVHRSTDPATLPAPDEVARERRRRRLGAVGQPDVPGVWPLLSRHVLSAAVAEGRGVSDLARAIALVDAAAAVADLDVLGLRRRARRLGEEGLAALLDQVDELGSGGDVDGTDLEQYLPDPDALADVVDLVSDLVPPAMDRRVNQLLDRLRNRVEAPDGPGARAVPPLDRRDVIGLAAENPAPRVAEAPRTVGAQSRRPVAELLRVDGQTLPDAIGRHDVAARAITDSEAEVRIVGRADLAGRWWARAFPVGDQTPVAVGRFAVAGTDAVARLLVPPSALHDATFDVTDRPGEPRSPVGLRSVRKAAAAGRAASRAERLGNQEDAAERWSDCAAAWARAGDVQRAEQAEAFGAVAAGRGSAGRSGVATVTRRIPAALLSDPLVDAGR